MTQPLLAVRGVKTFYGNIMALKGIDLDVNDGEIVTLIGANGAGKSTLMMTIFGNPRASEGSIAFDGRDITQMPSHEIARLRIAQSPEGRRIFPRMSVLENLQMGATVADPAHFDEDVKRVCALFPLLDRRMRQRGGTLSGGEQQMLAIARALMSRPRLLLLDEPSLGLAPMLAQQIFRAIRELNTRDRLTVFLVEQNAFHALEARAPRLCHRQRRDHAVRLGPRTAGAARGARRLSRRRPPRGGRALRQAARSPLGFARRTGGHSCHCAHLARLVVLAARRLSLPRSPGPAFAQSGAIRIIVGVPAGGAIDPYARMIADHMSKTLGHPIIVENKPGASGNVAAQYIADQPADGSIIWLGTQAFTEITPNVFKNSRWSIDNFQPIIRGVEAPLVFVVHPSVPASNFAEFLAWAKAEQGQAQLLLLSGRHAVAFPRLPAQREVRSRSHPRALRRLGTAGQRPARRPFAVRLRAGELDVPQYAAGKLKALGTPGAKRDRSMPDVPTFAELGYPEFTAKVWFGLLVKEGTPPDVAQAADRRRQSPPTPIPRSARSSKPRATKSPAKPGRSS